MYVGGMLSFDNFEGVVHLISSWVLSNSHLTIKNAKETVQTVHIDLNISINVSCAKTILLSRFLRPHAGRVN